MNINNNVMKITVIILLILYQQVFADIPKLYTFHTSNLSISSVAPPILIYIEDLQERRSGADPNLPVTKDGMQGANPISGLEEIPLSLVIQDRTENVENPNQTSLGTGWNINIFDSGKQTYQLHVIGMRSDVATMSIVGILRSNPKNYVHKMVNILIESSKERILYLAYDSEFNTISIKKDISGEELISDIDIVCNIKLINRLECKYLRKLAEEINKALDSNNDRLAKRLLLEFIGKLKKPSKHGRDEVDVYTILREDALSLLSDIDGGICHFDKKKKKKHCFKHGWKDHDKDK